ncbi:MAG: exonuclease SbcCD subunit D [Candidatus Parvarchaeota archaeon]|jgi:DNA repair exonuclease SbcCD nuclease subunit|nr:exonuclease SbcCD subunit D [Candidatus Parvarchaeota archaeon]MCL5106912.1 exonuclease SbcCD subunit D [Candidatus Parvarchaeota archaeon]
MKFIHVGDTHIGQVYKNDTRNNDIKDAFIQMITYAISEKIDFIVHSGDLFDSGNPPLDSLLFMTDELNRLKIAGIPLFIIPGSHDVGIGEEESIIELFHRNKLLINLNSKKYIEFGEKVTLTGETYKNAFICGIKGKRSKVEDEIFKKLTVDIDNSAFIKIFAFHHTISYLGEKFKDLETESLPKGFDYYAAGHWHGYKENIKYDKGIIQYPGSLEYCDEKEIVDNPNRGFFIISYDEKGINDIKYKIIKTRAKQIFTIKADNKTAIDVENEMLNKLNKNEGDILVLRLEGRLNDKTSDINVIKVKKMGYELGYSYISINKSKLNDKDVDVQVDEIKTKELSTIEYEFLKKKGYNDKEIRIARYLIDSVGEKPDSIKKEVENIFYSHDNIEN